MLTIETPSDVELRTALALSAATGAAVYLEAVGAATDRAGVWRPHLSWAQAAASMCGAEVEAQLGGESLVFLPGPVTAGVKDLSIGLGHSAVEVALVALPAALVAPGVVELCVRGSTHAPGSGGPSWLQVALAPWIASLGRTLAVTEDAPGFPPAGGQLRICVSPVEPGARSAPATGMRAVVTVGHLPDEVAAREVELLRAHNIHDVQVRGVHSASPGNAVCVEVGTTCGCEVFEACGARGVSGATLVEAVWSQVDAWVASGAQVAPATADVLVVALALAGGGEFTASALSPDTERIAEITEKYVDVEVSMAKQGDRVTIRVRP